MSTEPLRHAIDSTRTVLSPVTPDQLGLPTPCAKWTVSELINHIVGGQHFFASSVSGDASAVAEADFAAGDYVAAFDDASAACLAAFEADGAMEKMLDLPFGKMPGAAFIAPNAPDPCANNPAGFQWFPIPHLDGSSEAESFLATWNTGE